MLAACSKFAAASVLAIAVAAPGVAAPSPNVVATVAPVIVKDGKRFKDLNRNGTLDPYEDWRLPVSKRIDDLVARMTVEEKAGLMMYASQSGFVGPNGEVMDKLGPPPPGALKSPVNIAGVPGFDAADRPSPRDLILRLNVRWMGAAPSGSPSNFAQWTNGVQKIAEGSRLGIPLMLGSDPVHTTNRLPGGALPPPDRRKITSNWPDQIGLAAAGDPALVERLGVIASAELRALGLRVIVNPIADVVTEPRWNRIPGTFGEDATQAATLVAAYVRGIQGHALSPTSVLAIAKHFPGDGPVENGLDPHNAYGQSLVYPAGMQDYHLKPFRAAIGAGVGSIMTSYGIPTGLDTVGSAFSKPVVTGLLRNTLGYRGIVISDWLHAMPWGVESLSKEDRWARMIAAGVDQFGGEHQSTYVVNLVRSGKVSVARLDESARRILRPMFSLGMFENPYVDPAAAAAVVNSPAFAKAAAEAQRRAIVLLKNKAGLLPLKPNAKIALSGFSAVPAALAGRVVEDPTAADVVIVRVNAPYLVNHSGKAFFRETHEGPLVYAGAENAADLALIRKAVASGKPVITLMSMERPAVLTEFLDTVDGMIATFGSGDDAVADVLTGAFRPSGKLPFDLPADEMSVETQKSDAPHDFAHVLYHQGFGLTYPGQPAHK